MSCMVYKSLAMYQKCVKNINMSVWWKACKMSPNHVRKCRTLMTIITGGHSLGVGGCRFVLNTNLCQLCDIYVEEDITHFLLMCEGLDRERKTLMQNVTDAMPPAMVDSLSSMSHENQLVFLLGELGSTDVREWYGIHWAVIELVHGLYKAREALLKTNIGP